MDVLSASFRNDTIAWYENDGNQSFRIRLITTTADGALSVDAADVDGDGDLDVLSASTYDGSLVWYENDSLENFTEHVIPTDAAKLMVARDLDADGDTDIVGMYGYTIAWYENIGGLDFPVHFLSTSADFVDGGMEIADMEDDRDLDLFYLYPFDGSQIGWIQNNGAQSFIPRKLTDNIGLTSSTFAVDFDGDGDVDVLSTSGGLLWHENDGHQQTTRHLLSTSVVKGSSVSAPDMDGDGDLDILLGEYRGLSWYENDGNFGFSQRPVSGTSYRNPTAKAIDLDHDGDLDVLSAGSRFDPGLSWHENDGRENFTTHLISDSASRLEVSVADVDGDGDLDVVAVSETGDRVFWYENNGDQQFNHHGIEEFPVEDPKSMFIADMDGDGDLDLLLGFRLGPVKWYRNDGDHEFVSQTISTTLIDTSEVEAADMDGDGDLDIVGLSSRYGQSRIVWFENTSEVPHVKSVGVNTDLADPLDLPAGDQPSSWQTQRSDIRSFTVVFSEEVLISVDDLVLTNLGVNAPVDTDDALPLTETQLSTSEQTLTINFTEDQLAEGVYQLTILPSATDLDGSPLDGDRDGIPGGVFQWTGNPSNGFYQLTAEWNGDGGVTIFDFPVFAYWFSQSIPAAPEYVDLNGDGGITIFDFPEFASNFGAGVTFPTMRLCF